MFLINLSNIFFLLYLILHYLQVSIFDSLITGVLSYPDLLFRLDLNDTILNSYNFFWTSVTFLSLVYIILLLIFDVYYWGSKFFFLKLSLLAFLVWLGLGVGDFYGSNNNFSQIELNLSAINTLLLNTLNKYHPFLLYLSVFSLLSSLAYIPKYTKLNFGLNYFLSIFRLLIVSVLLLSFTALYLGGWWAFQEGTWGGWWGWDPSEVLGLLLFLISLQFFHSGFDLEKLISWRFRLLLFITLLVYSYYFLQLNFELTSHSFGSRFTYFFNSNLMYLELLFLTLLLVHIYTKIYLFFIFRIQSLLKSNLSQILNTSEVSWLKVLVFIITLLVGFSTYNVIWHYFMWNFFQINLFNLGVFLYCLITFLIHLVLLVTHFGSIIVLMFGSLWLVFQPIPLYWFWTSLVLIRVSFFTLVHFILLLTTLINTYEGVVEIPQALVGDSRLIYSVTFESLVSQVFSQSCTPFMVEEALLSVEYWKNFSTSYTLFYNSNSVSIASFTLLEFCGGFTNLWLLGTLIFFDMRVIEFLQTDLIFNSIFTLVIVLFFYPKIFTLRKNF